MKLHFLKTVWSDMIILESNGKFGLVDTGFADQYDQLKEYMETLGVKEIDFILLTHFHRDHYGNIDRLVQDYPVKRVFFKEYGGHDRTTAWGAPADEAYIQSEKDIWKAMRDVIVKHSTLYMVENRKSFDFSGTTFFLYATGNTVKEIFEDADYPETYQKTLFNENQNSLGVFFEADGKTVFLGGDMLDMPSPHPLANYVTLQAARAIGREIDVYKAPHHATSNTASEEALTIFRPKKVIVTNAMEWYQNFDTPAKLARVVPEAEIILTEKQDVVVDLTRERER